MTRHAEIPHFRSDLEIAFDLFRPVLEPVIAQIVKKEVNKILLSDTDGTSNLYSRKETAEKLRISPSTVINWEHDGKLTPVNKGKRVFYRREQVISLVSNF